MTMFGRDVIVAKQEAERFLRMLAAYEACATHSTFDACPDRAAAKRASMDLTRALAKLRQGR